MPKLPALLAALLAAILSACACAADREYIVTFAEYSPASGHAAKLSVVLESEAAGAWQHVPRRNPATERFDSDFALIRVPMDSVAACTNRVDGRGGTCDER